MLWRALKPIVGVLCIVLGLLALVTPLTPGSWLALVGLELLGLSQLLPRPVRERWEAFKKTLGTKWKKLIGGKS
jgi:hypothetical protein